MKTENTMRFLFAKNEKGKYISHLDMHRAIKRAIMRAGIKIRYSNGFNPHPRLTFLLTSGLGALSNYDILEIGMPNENQREDGSFVMPPEEFLEKLAPCLPPCITPIDAYYAETPAKEIKFSSYDIALEFKEKVAKEEIINALSGSLVIMKRSKSGIKEVDIAPQIKDFSVSDELVISALLTAENENYLNPENVIKALQNNERLKNLLVNYKITRTGIQKKDLSLFR